MIIPNIGKNKNVPNHQPENLCWLMVIGNYNPIEGSLLTTQPGKVRTTLHGRVRESPADDACGQATKITQMYSKYFIHCYIYIYTYVYVYTIYGK